MAERVNIPLFVTAVSDAVNTVNATFPDDPHSLSPEYLLVLAWIESGWRNIPTTVTDAGGNPASSALGPFQFTSDTWNDMVGRAEYADVLDGILPSDRPDVVEQCNVAACYAHRIQRELHATIKEPPSQILMRLGHLLGVSGVKRFVKLKPGEPVNKIVAGTPAVSAAAIANNRRLLAEGDAAASRAAVEARVSAEMKAAAGEIVKLIGPAPNNPPAATNPLPIPFEALTSSADHGDVPPWYKIALQELSEDVVEQAGTPTDPNVVEYFDSIGIKGGDHISWCAAFVSYCLIKGGADTLKGLRKAMDNTPERAANWIKWGQSLKEPHIGAVVVLKPSPGASGHVGFYAGQTEGGKILLLGGNQNPPQGGDDQVCIAEFPRSRLRTDSPYRWPLNA